MDKVERKRIARKREDILSALRLSGKNGITNAELSKIALRYGGHLGKLYEQGYKIDKQSLGEGLYKYTLISEPEKVISRQKALDKLLSEVEKLKIIDKNALVELLDTHGIQVKYKANTYKL